MFKSILQKIVDEADCGLGAIVMGQDGIAVEEYLCSCGETDLHLLTVEYASVLKEIRKSAQILGTGPLEEVSIRTRRFSILLRPLSEEYFVGLILEHNGNFGKGRYLLLRESFALREQLG